MTLRLIDEKRYLKRDHILTYMSDKYPSIRVLNRRLKVLYENYYIDRVFPPVELYKGSSQQFVCLDKAGWYLLGYDKYNKPFKIRDGILSLPSGWKHYETILDIDCYLRNKYNTLLSNIQRKIKFQEKEFIPDLLSVIESKENGFVFFIEVDMGTEDSKIIKDKIKIYNDYFQSNGWKEGVWNQYFEEPVFPMIIFYTNRIHILRKIKMNTIIHPILSSNYQETFSQILSKIGTD